MRTLRTAQAEFPSVPPELRPCRHANGSSSP
ncbi:hypothetical protein SRB17_46070 [Streptomyces sp. RB17]|nr:hypothetical protein [Streptomyces sp. RB17]